MKNILLSALLLIPGLALACSVDHISVKDSYVRAMPEGQKTTAAYMKVENDSDKAIHLVGVSSPLAESAQLHEVVTTKGVEKMKEVKSITLAPKEFTTLDPGSYHIMLLGLKETLKPGQLVPVTLTFDDKKSMVVEMPVRDIRSEDGHAHSH